jgi:hypothetical protein
LPVPQPGFAMATNGSRRGFQRLRAFLEQRQPSSPYAQAVLQAQTGLQLQLQFSQLQEALDEAVSWVGLFFMDDLVSTRSTESFARSYNAMKNIGHRQS